MENNKEKQGLELLIKALAEKQVRSSSSSTDRVSPNKTLAKQQQEQWIHTRETRKIRQNFHYPPITPEDIVQSVLTGISKGILDGEADPVVASLMDTNEIRKMIEVGRLDASELPLLKYRVDKLIGINSHPNPPDGREMLSSLAYYYRTSVEKLNQIRAEALEDMMDDYQLSLISSEELEKYRQELNIIIDQYLSNT